MSVSFTIDRTSIVKTMALVGRSVEKRNTIPVLSNVLLTAGTSGLAITATDLDIEARATLITEDLRGAGSITVPAATLTDIVRKISAPQIMISWESDDGPVILRAGRSRFNLQALPASDFPEFPVADLPHAFTLESYQVQRMIARTSFAISTEETRYYLNGIYLHTVEGHLRTVATDGHRLARFDVPAPDGAEGMPGVIVPRKTVAEIERLAKDHGGLIEIAISPSKIRIIAGATRIVSKLVDGTYPDYSRVIPTQNDRIASLDRAALADAADRVSTISSERGRAVRLSLTDGTMRLSVTNPDSGTAEEEVEADYAGDEINVGFNSRYLADAMAAIGGERVTLALQDPGAPALITTPSDSALLVVLMPMRV